MIDSSLRRRAIAALVLVNVLWGISFPVMTMTNRLMQGRHVATTSNGSVVSNRLVAPVTSTAFYMTVRFALALVLLRLLMPDLFRSLTAAQWRMGAWAGLSFSTGSILQILALNQVPASRSGFLTSLAVVFTPVLMIVVERRLPRWAVIGGASLALAGTSVLTGLATLGGPVGIRFTAEATSRVQLGDWLTVLAAFIFAVQIIQIDVFSRRMPSGKLTPGMFLATLGFGSVVFLIGQIWQPAPRGVTVWGELIGDASFLSLTVTTSLLCTVAAFYLMNRYQAYVSPAHAALIYTVEPICATVWAMVLPDVLSPLIGLSYPSERPGSPLAAGAVFIIAGNLLALWPTHATHSKPLPASTSGERAR